MDLTQINLRLKSALAVDHHGAVTGNQITSIIKPLVDAIGGLNKEILTLEKKIERLEKQLQSLRPPAQTGE